MYIYIYIYIYIYTYVFSELFIYFYFGYLCRSLTSRRIPSIKSGALSAGAMLGFWRGFQTLAKWPAVEVLTRGKTVRT